MLLMVYIDSCEKCKNDCENGMRCGGFPHRFCGKNMITYYCPITGGAYEVSLETARNKYGYYGKAFEELDINRDYGKFQSVVEHLAVLRSTYRFKQFSANEVCSNPNYIEFKVRNSEYAVFQVTYREATTDFSYYGGSSNHSVVGYCDTIRITEDNHMIGLVGHREVFDLEDNHIKRGVCEGVCSVSFRHLK